MLFLVAALLVLPATVTNVHSSDPALDNRGTDGRGREGSLVTYHIQSLPDFPNASSGEIVAGVWYCFTFPLEGPIDSEFIIFFYKGEDKPVEINKRFHYGWDYSHGAFHDTYFGKYINQTASSLEGTG